MAVVELPALVPVLCTLYPAIMGRQLRLEHAPSLCYSGPASLRAAAAVSVFKAEAQLAPF